MTEAAHQMASNPLPPADAQARIGRPRHRRRGSASCDENGHAARRRRARRGRASAARTSITGYENNPEANATAFFGGWFRTGDQGILDEQGYLTLDRPPQGADQPRRREDLAARDRRGAADASRGRRGRLLRRAAHDVGRRSGGGRRAARREAATEADLLAYCKERLADFKRPKQIHITEAIPRTATGKIQRRVVAQAYSRRKAVVRIVIAGAGAIGGYIGARLARAGADVVLFARGPHLAGDAGARTARHQCRRRFRGAARRSRGDLGDDRHGRRRVPRRQGAQPDRARAAACARCSGPTPSSSARRTASRGGISRVTAASSRAAPRARGSGRRHRGGHRAAPRRRIAGLLRDRHRRARRHPPHRGQPHQLRRAGRRAIRAHAAAIAEALIAAGFRCPITTRFRHEIWVKLLGNVAFNPISALTGGTLEELARHPRRVAARARR